MAHWPRVMRNRFDYISKQIGQKALAPFGTAVVQDAINAETQYADLRFEPDPARQAGRDRLGLLGELGASACLIEVYSGAPQPEDFRACLPSIWSPGGNASARRDRRARSKTILRATKLRPRSSGSSQPARRRRSWPSPSSRLHRAGRRGSTCSEMMS